MMEKALCVPCAEKLKGAGYTLRVCRHGANQKVDCRGCGRRRYGSVYEVATPKKKNPVR